MTVDDGFPRLKEGIRRQRLQVYGLAGVPLAGGELTRLPLQFGPLRRDIHECNGHSDAGKRQRPQALGGGRSQRRDDEEGELLTVAMRRPSDCREEFNLAALGWVVIGLVKSYPFPHVSNPAADNEL